MKFAVMQGKKVKGNQVGFTLVELITVVAIVSLLVVYITIRLGSSNEDAKVALASTFILGKVPTVISAYKARHMSSCKGLDTATSTDDGGSLALRNQLIERGLVPNTPWDEEWGAKYDEAERRLQIMFPLQGMENPQVSAKDIVDNIYDAPQIDGLKVVANGTAMDEYAAIEKNEDGSAKALTVDQNTDRKGSIQIWYDCI